MHIVQLFLYFSSTFKIGLQLSNGDLELSSFSASSSTDSMKTRQAISEHNLKNILRPGQSAFVDLILNKGFSFKFPEDYMNKEKPKDG